MSTYYHYYPNYYNGIDYNKHNLHINVPLNSNYIDHIINDFEQYENYDNDTEESEYDEPKVKKQKIYKEIDVKINNLSDLINIIELYPYDEDYEYNINLKALHDIKDELNELNNMIGMQELKSSVLSQLLYFLQELHVGSDDDYKHTVIYGPPGTGKTEIAQILGKMYSKIGILKNNIFKKVGRSDLIAGFLGQTAIKTKDVIKECLGGVLFIDEAYSLGSDGTDSFSKECLDTLCNALSENKNDLMVIIAGYEHDLDKYFFDLNQGLNSRFIWRFKTKEYTAQELFLILKKKINKTWYLEEEIKDDWFVNKIKYFTSYGRDIEALYLKIKIAHSFRIYGKDKNMRKKINLEDVNKGFEMFIDNPKIKNRNEISLNYSMYL
jgi:SpoVK/Ycf46/Vps4 family AAA+-type ATPase